MEEKIKNILLDNNFNLNRYNRNKTELFNIMEETIILTIPTADGKPVKIAYIGKDVES